jgi:hypothetical protein
VCFQDIADIVDDDRKSIKEDEDVNQKPYIKEGETISWPKIKSTHHELQNITQKTKDLATRTP